MCFRLYAPFQTPPWITLSTHRLENALILIALLNRYIKKSASFIHSVPKAQARCYFFIHVSHYMAFRSHFHPSVRIYAAPPIATAQPSFTSAMGLNDGLFALHDRVISDSFLLRCKVIN